MVHNNHIIETATRVDKHWLLVPTENLPWTAFRQSGKTNAVFNLSMIIRGKNILRIKYRNLTRLMVGSPLWKIYVRIMNRRLIWWLRKLWWSY